MPGEAEHPLYHPSAYEDLAMIRVVAPIFVGLLWITSAAIAQPASSEKSDKAAPTQDELDKQFAETMSGATLVGNFTVAGMEGEKPFKPERYTLGKVSKLKNGYWQFETRIQYGDHDVKLPLALEVKWSGDTPMITLTDVTIPGLGTYTARVLVYRNQYAGTWSGSNHGGHLFGKVVREEGDKPTAEKK